MARGGPPSESPGFSPGCVFLGRCFGRTWRTKRPRYCPGSSLNPLRTCDDIRNKRPGGRFLMDSRGTYCMSTVTAETSQIIKLALSKIGDIATLPEVTTRIIAVVDDPRSTARDLHTIITND